jgi:2-methylisocitrate lyase-like PEP mutase family enzyme
LINSQHQFGDGFRGKALEQIALRIVIYGILLLMHAVRAMENVLAGLAHGTVDFAGKGVEFEDYRSILGFEQWAAIEAKYQPAFWTPASL